MVRVSLRFGGDTGRQAGLWAGRLGRKMIHFVEEKWPKKKTKQKNRRKKRENPV